MSKILICSNDEKIREVIKNELYNEYDLILCEAATQCLEIIDNTKTGLLLLDLDDQDDASDAIAEVKSQHPKLKIIALSGAKKDQVLNEAVKSGATGFIRKPIKKEDLTKICK